MKSLKQLLFTALCLIIMVACKNENKETSTNSTAAPAENTEERKGQAFIKDDGSTPNCLQIAIGSPDHKTLVAAVQAAQVENALVNVGPLTVFAPTDAAFDALPAGTVEALLMDPTGDLRDILLYHVLGADVRSGDLSDGQMATTLNGGDITVTINNSGVFINDAQVTVVDLVTDNGVVHVIDAVLIPMTSSTSELSDFASFKMYPNPATNLVNIEMESIETTEGNIRILDFSGKLVRSYNNVQKQNSYNVSDINPGIYLLEYNGEGMRYYKKLVLE